MERLKVHTVFSGLETKHRYLHVNAKCKKAVVTYNMESVQCARYRLTEKKKLKVIANLLLHNV